MACNVIVPGLSSITERGRWHTGSSIDRITIQIGFPAPFGAGNPRLRGLCDTGSALAAQGNDDRRHKHKSKIDNGWIN